MGFIHIQNSNFGANRYTDNIDNLFKNCIVQLFPSLGTTGTFPVSDINGSFLRVVNNGSDFCFQQLDIITNKHTTSYIRSWYYGNDTVYPGWSDWRRVITNADLASGAVSYTGLTAGGVTQKTITFGKSFSKAPIVLVQPVTSNTAAQVRVRSIAATSFIIDITLPSSMTELTVYWCAIISNT